MWEGEHPPSHPLQLSLIQTLIAHGMQGVVEPETIRYLSDGLETCALPYNKVHISVLAIITGKKKSVNSKKLHWLSWKQ